MNLVFESLIILTILSLNFGIIIWFKNRIALLSSVMVINLTIILLCIIRIDEYQILKELIIAIVIYSITVLSLIVIGDNLSQDNENKFKIRFLSKKKLIFIAVIAVSCGSFYLVKDIKIESLNEAEINEEKIIETIITEEPILTDTGTENVIIPTEIVPQNTKKNIPFKRSTDAILIIVGVMTALLLASKYSNRESN